MKKIIMAIFFISILIISVGCESSEIVEDEAPDEMIVVGYSGSFQEEIFGDLSREEIDKILNEISEEVRQDEEYEKNMDSIIEDVFKENGIEEEEKINTAKAKIEISK